MLPVKLVALLRTFRHLAVGEGLGLRKAHGTVWRVPGALKALLSVIGTGFEHATLPVAQ